MENSKQPKALYLVGIIAWLIPGGGHWMLGQKNRAVAIFFGIVITFIIGIFLGGTELIDPRNAWLWFCAQIFTGLPAVAASLIQNPAVLMGNGRAIDLGQLYTSVAGLLNVLCILDALIPTPPKPALSKPKAQGATAAK